MPKRYTWTNSILVRAFFFGLVFLTMPTEVKYIQQYANVFLLLIYPYNSFILVRCIVNPEHYLGNTGNHAGIHVGFDGKKQKLYECQSEI